MKEYPVNFVVTLLVCYWVVYRRTLLKGVTLGSSPVWSSCLWPNHIQDWKGECESEGLIRPNPSQSLKQKQKTKGEIQTLTWYSYRPWWNKKMAEKRGETRMRTFFLLRNFNSQCLRKWLNTTWGANHACVLKTISPLSWDNSYYSSNLEVPTVRLPLWCKVWGRLIC